MTQHAEADRIVAPRQSVSPRPIRVLHCPTTVGGNPQGLARAEREIGLDSTTVTFLQNYMQYEADETLFLDEDGYFRRERKRWGLVWRAIRNYDIVHFNFGETLMPKRYFSGTVIGRRRRSSHLARLWNLYAGLFEMRDLPLLKMAGKGIVMTYQGDDARQGDYCREHFEITLADEVPDWYYGDDKDRHKRRAIGIVSRYADKIFALNPDLMHVLPEHTEFVPYASVDPRDWRPVESNWERPVVIHAPSYQSAKGSRYIVDAVKRLRAEGVPFEFRLIEGLSHAEARREYERADLLVDQVLVGWYGALAVELMALGKPVICYLREGDLSFIPTEMREELPIIPATPRTIYDVLKSWLTARRAELHEQGQRSRAFVEKWHDPLRIAERMKADYEVIRGRTKPTAARA